MQTITTSRTAAFQVAYTNKRCWIVALETVLKASPEKIETVARQNGWDGVKPCLTVNEFALTLWDLTGKKMSFAGTKEITDLNKTPKQFSETTQFTGYIIVDGHVMPCVKGRVSNYCGYGDYPIILIVH